MNDQNNGFQHGDEAATRYKSTKDNKAYNGSRRPPIRSQSMGPLTTSHQVAGKEMAESKRRCLRRQYAGRFKSCDEEPRENLFELEDINCSDSTPLGSRLMHVDNATSKDANCVPRCDPRELQITSFGRPSRKAAVKIQSYKEIPLNIKMRRSE